MTSSASGYVQTAGRGMTVCPCIALAGAVDVFIVIEGPCYIGPAVLGRLDEECAGGVNWHIEICAISWRSSRRKVS